MYNLIVQGRKEWQAYVDMLLRTCDQTLGMIGEWHYWLPSSNVSPQNAAITLSHSFVFVHVWVCGTRGTYEPC